MMKYTLTADDAVKLKRAHDDLRQIIEWTEEYNKGHDKKRKTSSLVTHAYQCLEEVLYGIN